MMNVQTQQLLYTEQKRKLTHTLFSNISQNTYPMKMNFMSNSSVFNSRKPCVIETQMQCRAFQQ